jgi:hypothetical protein
VAKKKSRTPPPPRPVQAPKVRQDSRGPRGGARDPRRTRLIFIGIGVGIVVIVLASVLGVALGGGGGGGSDQELSIGGCVAQTFEDQGNAHATELPEGYEYNSFPPTSGTHNPVPAIYGIYLGETIDRMLLVHNLEHGAVVVQYGDQVPQADVDRIAAWYAEDPNGLIVAELPELKDKVALTAWTHVLTCPGFNPEAFDRFTEAYRYKGPERFSPDAMRPGTN